MLAVLRNPTYARLFSAQIIALLGTGLLTVALGLLAYDIAGSDAGAVMGTVMAIKMVAYVLVSPVTTALVSRLPARRVLIGADLVRAGVAVSLPFVTEAWQTYVLIFLLQSASATFTPTFQAVIPSVLPDEREYTRALSLSRLAYDLESLVSPLLAAALLTVMAYNNLFFGTVIGFLVSAALVALARFPAIQAPEPAPFLDRLTRGTRAYWARLELRGLLGVNLVVATTTSMVIVNTVVLVQADLGRPQQDVALLLAAYGGGSMVVALGLPRVLDAVPDRRVMLAGAAALPVLLLAAVGAMSGLDAGAQWAGLLVLWALMGAATAAVLTPSARLLRRNSTERTRPSVFAAQFSLSHACFLLTYPLAGLLGARIGLPAVGVVLVGIGAAGLALTVLAWRRAEGQPPVDR
ncbi:MFS transporter [Micrococcus luteus]|nr:MFS transporter [Micrococcus luteus]